jgi:hypothetical protein
MRNDRGMYSDGGSFNAPHNQGSCSIASVGMGLVTLCIADACRYDALAEAKVLKTLQALAGKVPGFNPSRNSANGFFRHFIDMNTGGGGGSEYSSIDSGILTAGALFCKKYFSANQQIAQLADSLFLSIKWSAAIANPTTGQIYMIMDNTPSAMTSPFNEYMIVAWLAKNYAPDNARAIELWNKWYATPQNCPKIKYSQYELLTDQANYMSNFVAEFPYYFVNPFTVSTVYWNYFLNHLNADRKWFRDNTTAPAYIWGTGAGSTPSGYNADNFNNNPQATASPHIQAGFIPADTGIVLELNNLWKNNLGVYTFNNTDHTKILWKHSVRQPAWRAGAIQGVDFSTTVFGLAAHPRMLGCDFFKKYNNFDFPGIVTASRKDSGAPPSGRGIIVRQSSGAHAYAITMQKSFRRAEVALYDVRGRVVTREVIHNPSGAAGYPHTVTFDAPRAAGLFILQVSVDSEVKFKTDVKL